ncbi:glycine/betaine/sarcosine/D-proline family reductase selenoprotein B [Tissierella carlieri]|nr:glycine/betaine/sarcosine/D-proline family reductase selenoprotein B [Tissierella carlieri]
MKKILFYTNQFFGQIGGEEKASIRPKIEKGIVGSANLFKDLEGEIIATIICGDNYYAENMEETRKFISKHIEKLNPDLVVAGPAFNAGRFGIACGDICSFVNEKYGINTITGMYIENPAVEIYKSNTYIVETGNSAATMRKAVLKMSKLANKLLKNEDIGLPNEEGYIPKGIRINVFKEKNGAERALDMLIKKLKGEEFKTEIPIPIYNTITPAEPIFDIKKAKIALLTTSGLVPIKNPDHLPAATAKFYKKYPIDSIERFEEGEFESVHAGFDPVYANHNPNRLLPLDLYKQLEKDGEIGNLHEHYFVTTGNSTSVADATKMGKEIAQELLDAGVDGVIMTST